MKTIEQWFQELPAQIKERAIKNTPTEILNSEESSIQDSVIRAFLWIGTEEGWDFWNLVWENEFDKAQRYLLD